jgi:O-antigen ligase
MLQYKKFYLEYIVTLIPILLITGPFLPDLFLSIACLFFLIKIINNKKFDIFFNNIFFRYFVIFWLCLILSSILGDPKNFFNSIQSSIFYLRFGIFVVLIKYLMNNNKNFSLLFLYSISIAILLATLFATVQFIYIRAGLINEIIKLYINTTRENFNYHWGEIGPSVFNRLTLGFSDWQVVGSFIVRLLPLSFILVLWKIDNEIISAKESFLIKIVFTLIFFIVWCSGERAAFIFLIIQLILLFLLIKRLRIFFKKFLVIGILLVLLSIYIDPVSKGRMITQTVDNLTEKNKIHFITKVHEGHIFGAWKIFLNNKYFGAGLKGFRYECFNKDEYIKNPKIICTTHPHNILMQFLSETGIVGFIFYITTFLIVSFILFKKFFYILIKKNKLFIEIKKKKFFIDDYQICAIIAVFITLWPIASTGSFSNNWLSIIYFIPVAFCLNKINLKN